MTGEAFDPIGVSTALVPTLKETAAASEDLRRVDPDAIDAITRSGLSRMLTPLAQGGYELSPSAHIRSCRVLAHGCPAASWVHMVFGAHTFCIGRFSNECQQEIFDGNPDTLIPGTLAPQGSARQTADGWLVNGRWQFASGVDHGDWLLIGAKGVAENGEDSAAPVHVFVPKQDLTVLDTWHTLGMRGTGSKDVVATDVFVPAHRGMATAAMFSGEFGGNAGPVYRLPVAPTLATMLAACVLGIAETGYALFIEATRVRGDVYFGGGKAEKAGIQRRVAEAQGELETAALLVEQSCAIFDTAVANNGPTMSLKQRGDLRWKASYAAELCRRATERIFASAGAHAIYDDSPLQTVYRDVNTVCHHAIVDFDGSAEIHGKLELGLTRGIFGVSGVAASNCALEESLI